MEKEISLMNMTRKEFEEYKKNSKFCNKPYEFYRVYPILNSKSQKELNIFVRTHNNPVDIIKECARLLEKELSTQK
jgi:hypothetical protein